MPIKVPQRARDLIARFSKELFFFEHRPRSHHDLLVYMEQRCRQEGLALVESKLDHYQTNNGKCRKPENYEKRTYVSRICSLGHELSHHRIEKKVGTVESGWRWVFGTPYRFSNETVASAQGAIMCANVGMGAIDFDTFVRRKVATLDDCQYALPYDREGRAVCMQVMRKAYSDQLSIWAGWMPLPGKKAYP